LPAGSAASDVDISTVCTLDKPLPDEIVLMPNVADTDWIGLIRNVAGKSVLSACMTPAALRILSVRTISTVGRVFTLS
jgi:hypothetical protein